MCDNGSHHSHSADQPAADVLLSRLSDPAKAENVLRLLDNPALVDELLAQLSLRENTPT